MTNLTGQTMGKYRITAQLGRGGMAEVYKAYQPSLDRYVALKVMHSHLANDEDFIGRFEREAAAVARLRHPNIVQVHDFDVEGDRYYMVMEFVEGPTLKAELKERSTQSQPFTLPETNHIFSALASAIDYAHSRGMVHRDLKPSNIMFTEDGQVVLTDFGIARMMGDSHITLTGQVMGTPAYMSPEQGQGKRGDERSDIYSLGVILYEMATGRVPFEADTPFAIIMKHISQPLPPPTAVNPNVPDSVERIICKALSKDPDDRYQASGQMARALGKAVGATREQIVMPKPITAIAPRPRIEEIPPEFPGGATPGLGHISTPPPTHIHPAPSTATASQASVPPAVNAAPQAVTTPLRNSLPILPLAIGIGVILLVCLVALAIIGIRAFTPSKTEEATINTPQVTTAIALPPLDVDTSTLVPTYTKLPPTPTITQHIVATITPVPATPTLTPLPPTDTPTPSPPPPSATATATAVPTPTQPVATPSPQAPMLTGKLAFSLTQGTSYKVYVVQVGPTPPISLYASIGNARQPALSHDGSWLLINGTGGEINAIARLTSDGHQSRPVTCTETTAESGRPVWSPDDRRMAFDGLLVDPARPQIYIQSIDEADCELVDNRLEIANGYVTDPNGLYPLWGPDGNVYFRSCATWDPLGASTCGIWSVQEDGSGARQLTDNPNHLPNDVNREQLIFMSSHQGNWELYSVSVRGGVPKNLTKHPGNDAWGTLSPDGRAIAFLSDRSGQWSIWLANVDGSNPQEWLPINADWGEIDPDRMAQERMSWSK
jgi:serine/threonine-protein kinase